MSTLLPQECRLCGQSKPLQVSHIIPRFIVEWFKETSATPYIRTGDEPNRRVQDGPKLRLFARTANS